MNRKIQMIRLILCRNGYRRAKYLKRKKFFYRQGENCCFVPYNYGTEPYLISFGNNVYVASGVTFINHDVTGRMIQNVEGYREKTFAKRVGKIEVGNNIYIGAGSTILYDVKIGNNVIIGAGSLVNRNIPDSGVYAGVPVRKVGDFDTYAKKVIDYSKNVNWKNEKRRKIIIQKQIAYFWNTEDVKMEIFHE